MKNAELIARLRVIAGKGMADYFNSGHPNSNAITEAADAIEALEASQERNTKYTLALQDDALKLQTEVERLTMALHGYQVAIEAAEESLKDRVALAMALDCGHRPPCEECKLYSPTAQQAQPEPSVPEGWKLVPIEPTEAMLEVGFFAEKDVFDSAKTKRIHVWKDMIAAAPQPKDMK